MDPADTPPERRQALLQKLEAGATPGIRVRQNPANYGRAVADSGEVRTGTAGCRGHSRALGEAGRITVEYHLQMRHNSRHGSFLGLAHIPHPCGYRSDPRRACSCTPPQVEKYLSKISGPLLDRIDLHVEVPAVPFTQLAEMPPGPTSADLRAQVLEARARQAKRFGSKGTQVNGRMTPRQVRKFCALKPEAMSLLKAAMEDLGLSAQAPHDKLLRVGADDRRSRRSRRYQAAEQCRVGWVRIARSERLRVIDGSFWISAGGLQSMRTPWQEVNYNVVKEVPMTILTPELRQEIEKAGDRPVRIEDPDTHRSYILLRAEIYDLIKPLSGSDDGPTEQVPEGIRRSKEAFLRDLAGLLNRKKWRGRWVLYHGDKRIGMAMTTRQTAPGMLQTWPHRQRLLSRGDRPLIRRSRKRLSDRFSSSRNSEQVS